MPTVFTLRQVTSVVGPAYQVVNTVAEVAPYVYATDTQKFSHYASAADMSRWPDAYAVAAIVSAGFYRQPSVTRVWRTAQQMLIDLSESKRRLQSLADELDAQVASFTTDTTTMVTGA